MTASLTPSTVTTPSLLPWQVETVCTKEQLRLPLPDLHELSSPIAHITVFPAAERFELIVPRPTFIYSLSDNSYLGMLPILNCLENRLLGDKNFGALQHLIVYIGRCGITLAGQLCIGQWSHSRHS